tara:strand:- start:717 stop:1754 length:1038 start_codon:yes stop_codon:yes gene_type:complete
MANIGISYWGFCEKLKDSRAANTPDGHRYGRPILVDTLADRGHIVYAMQEKREPHCYPGLLYAAGQEQLPDLDVLFIEWRFPTYKNFGDKKFEPDLDRQTELLNHYHGKIPIVIWDADYKMTPEDELAWPEAIICDPALEPKRLTRDRHRLMFWTDWKALMHASEDSFEYGYVGNNYERENHFKQYYSIVSEALRMKGIQTKVHGNWLQISPERESPDELIRKHPYIAFGPRLNFLESMEILNSFIVTTHITKPSYADCGFISPRYLENLAFNVPALVPHDFLKSDILGADWTIAEPGRHIKQIEFLAQSSRKSREDVVEEQRSAMKKLNLFDVNQVAQFLENLI